MSDNAISPKKTRGACSAGNGFVNYAHRGASEYLPENTLLSFYTGVYMGANGIETDIRHTKDGELVLFHDNSLERVCGVTGAVEDYTFEELQQFSVRKNGFEDRIVRFEDFLRHFSFRNITFAIELKGKDVEEGTATLLRRYGMAEKTVVTSFDLDMIRTFRQIAPEFEVGFLARGIDDALISELKAIGAEEICPKAEQLTPKLVHALHKEGFRVRAWGVGNEELMRLVVACGADGMTVNFPDKLTQLLRNN